MIPFTKEQLEQIREAHADIIWDSHHQMIEDMEAFNDYLNKMATAHTLATMILIEQDRNDRETLPMDSTEPDQISEQSELE